MVLKKKIRIFSIRIFFHVIFSLLWLFANVSQNTSIDVEYVTIYGI